LIERDIVGDSAAEMSLAIAVKRHARLRHGGFEFNFVSGRRTVFPNFGNTNTKGFGGGDL
jgi:hypothetical protein